MSTGAAVFLGMGIGAVVVAIVPPVLAVWLQERNMKRQP